MMDNKYVIGNMIMKMKKGGYWENALEGNFTTQAYEIIHLCRESC